MQNQTDKKFDIKPAEDQNALTAIFERERACEDAQLVDGAVRLFVRLLDMALNPMLNNGTKGKIIISQDDLGKMIHCDDRSIRRYSEQLKNGNYIWISKMPRRNTKMICVYHVTAFIPRRQVSQEMPGEGVRVNGARRYDTGFARTGAAATGQQRRVGGGLVDQYGRQVFFNLLEKSAVSGQERPLSPDNSVRSDRTAVSSATGQNCPVTADNGVLSHRSKLTAPTGQDCPVSEGNGVRAIESQIQSERGKTKTKNMAKGSQPALEGEREVGLADFLARMTRGEAKISGVSIAEKIVIGYRPQWVACFREDPDKALRALADVEGMLKQGEIEKSFGATWRLRWNQFASRKAVEK